MDNAQAGVVEADAELADAVAEGVDFAEHVQLGLVIAVGEDKSAVPGRSFVLICRYCRQITMESADSVGRFR